MKNKFIILGILLSLLSCWNNSTETTTNLWNENKINNEINIVEDSNTTINDDTIKIEENTWINKVEETEAEENIWSNEIEENSWTTNEIIKNNVTTENSNDFEDVNFNDNNTNTELISFLEVSNHSTSEDCYTIIEWKVYDLTGFFWNHMGWDSNLLKLCWTDWTEMFLWKHWENEKAIVTRDSFYIWELWE